MLLHTNLASLTLTSPAPQTKQQQTPSKTWMLNNIPYIFLYYSCIDQFLYDGVTRHYQESALIMKLFLCLPPLTNMYQARLRI